LDWLFPSEKKRLSSYVLTEFGSQLFGVKYAELLRLKRQKTLLLARLGVVIWLVMLA